MSVWGLQMDISTFHSIGNVSKNGIFIPDPLLLMIWELPVVTDAETTSMSEEKRWWFPTCSATTIDRSWCKWCNYFLLTACHKRTNMCSCVVIYSTSLISDAWTSASMCLKSASNKTFNTHSCVFKTNINNTQDDIFIVQPYITERSH